MNFRVICLNFRVESKFGLEFVIVPTKGYEAIKIPLLT